ncbi:L-alanine exporter AlaE [Vibrio vulnificus]|uniref:L-alanine exporter AlaE n=1 Tax=Vibrio vulnificus TaxID=672 RepID=UPI001029C578|nr:L-alanine exporter AlaE [Vibrio vulnificus]EGQ7957546.1 L-alanine exporter AlaE [Vibrio vulnificus]EGQ7988758.1 L-alanine exporter AlaE [Vibrio vulnificus]EGQ7993912.1 L-alanine exporter AlaE [Vibrio vulnificus]EGQ9239788.1 L-alanine exporter AlaE [Vibrio vulnificus]EGR7963806.1 L-alanine exporter AlaE [Vibrio vulnificus]
MKSRAPFCIRHAAADTFAMVVFCFISGMIIEILISGMTFQQSLASRTLSIPVNIAIAWPYGVFRDWVLRQGARVSTSGLMKNVSDLVAYVLFQSPVYAGILLAVGASTEQIITAVTSNAIISCGMGVLYGYFLDKCRRWFKVPGYYQQA